MLPQFLKSVAWFGIPSSLEVDQSKTWRAQPDPVHCRREWSTATFELWKEPGALELTLAMQPLLSTAGWGWRELPLQGYFAFLLPALPREVHCSHCSSCLALCWWVDCIRDFPGNLLSSRLVPSSPHPPYSLQPQVLEQSGGVLVCRARSGPAANLTHFSFYIRAHDTPRVTACPCSYSHLFY